jgi:hypothetical protein
VTTYKQIEALLQTYDLQDIFELNGLTDEDVLYFLVEEEFLELPEPKPLDFDEQ